MTSKLREFKDHVEESIFLLMDTIDNGDYEERFDLTLEMNGKKIAMPMHADLYERLTRFIQEEIDENEL